jgi:RimJ/RimL family protein N-acetyltransferase
MDTRMMSDTRGRETRRIPELETARLRLRAWRDDDLDALTRLNADPLVMRHMGRGPMTREETEGQLARFQAHWTRHGFGLWAAEDKETGRLAGRIGLSFHSVWPDDPEVGWLLGPAFWGRGLATEGGEASVRYGFERLEARRLVSICTPENAASRRVMEKLGFRFLTERTHDELGIQLWIHARERDATG